jgi:hypothetical protein
LNRLGLGKESRMQLGGFISGRLGQFGAAEWYMRVCRPI